MNQVTDTYLRVDVRHSLLNGHLLLQHVGALLAEGPRSQALVRYFFDVFAALRSRADIVRRGLDVIKYFTGDAHSLEASLLRNLE